MIIDLKKTPEFIDNMNWEPFLGNNHTIVKGYTCQNQGGVDFFKTFYHQPLNKRIWDDLFRRLCIKGLRIYKYDESEWLDGRGRDEMTIRLDKDGNIYSVYYYPSMVNYEEKYSNKDLMESIECLLNLKNGKIVDEEQIKKAEDICAYFVDRFNTPWTITETVGIGIINGDTLNGE